MIDDFPRALQLGSGLPPRHPVQARLGDWRILSAWAIHQSSWKRFMLGEWNARLESGPAPGQRANQADSRKLTAISL